MITMSLELDDNPTYGIDLEQEIADNLGREIAKEIDFELMSVALIEMGWHKVVLASMTWEQGCAIDAWVEENTRGKNYTMGLVWIFEEQRDAVNFVLKWS